MSQTCLLTLVQSAWAGQICRPGAFQRCKPTLLGSHLGKSDARNGPPNHAGHGARWFKHTYNRTMRMG